jgi:hypothetical protein
MECSEFQRTCHKQIYASRHDAKKSMAMLNRKFKNRGKKDKLNDVYFCDECQAWHITSMNKEQSRNITRKHKHPNK